MHLVVGLGNPGSEHRDHRHNIGFKVVDELHGRSRGGPMRTKFGAELCEVTLAGHKLLLCKPMEFMNVSGQAVARVAGFWKIPVADMVVVHDELDLPFGRLKLAAGGGHGGHNGVRSIIADLGEPAFARVRVGIGRPSGGGDAANYVLSTFSRAEAAELSDVVSLAADAVETIAAAGLTAAMNKFNVRSSNKPSGDRA
jgi:peptidyl-tRNA hydrolase, PTH1 family